MTLNANTVILLTVLPLVAGQIGAVEVQKTAVEAAGMVVAAL